MWLKPATKINLKEKTYRKAYIKWIGTFYYLILTNWSNIWFKWENQFLFKMFKIMFKFYQLGGD